jgi:hypothetical protein
MPNGIGLVNGGGGGGGIVTPSTPTLASPYFNYAPNQFSSLHAATNHLSSSNQGSLSHHLHVGGGSVGVGVGVGVGNDIHTAAAAAAAHHHQYNLPVYSSAYCDNIVSNAYKLEPRITSSSQQQQQQQQQQHQHQHHNDSDNINYISNQQMPPYASNTSSWYSNANDARFASK